MVVKEKVISSFGKGCKTYQSAAHLQSKVAKHLAARLDGIPNAILEVGCGTGLFSQYLIKAYPHANFLLTDISPNMLMTCAQQLSHLDNVEFLCTDGEKFNVDLHFDLIVSSMVFHWFNDPTNSLKKLTSRLNRKGKLLFAMLGSQSLVEWKQICLDFNLPNATPLFPSYDVLRKALPHFKIVREIIKQPYHHLTDFLMSFKRLGATIPRANTRQLGISEIRSVMREFNDPLTITYEVFYGEFDAGTNY